MQWVELESDLYSHVSVYVFIVWASEQAGVKVIRLFTEECQAVSLAFFSWNRRLALRGI